jgi:hypothetical protein
VTTPTPSLLPLQVTEDVAKRLAFIQYVFRLGEAQCSMPHPLSSAALLMFHDSVELFLVLVAERLNVLKKNMPFADYFAAIDRRIIPESLAEQGAMLRLNGARVNLKHYANPSPKDAVQAYRASTRGFLELNTTRIFGIHVDQVALSYLVDDSRTRQALVECEQQRAAGELSEASESVAIALVHLFRAFKMTSKTPFRGTDISVGQGGQGRNLSRHLNEHRLAIADLERDVQLLMRGLDLRRLSAFYRLTPSAHVMADGSARFTSTSFTPPPTPALIAFCYDFVIETALRLQAERADYDEVIRSIRGDPQ